MILKIYYLSKLYLLEQIRRQVHLVTLFLAVILLMLPAYVNSFSLGLSAFERVAKDFGLTLISFYAVAMAIFLGVTAVSSDLERRTLYPLLARPIPRWAYLMGKFVGVLVVLVSSVLVLSCCLMLSIAALAKFADGQLIVVSLCYALEASVLAAACIFFSTFSSPPLAGVLGVFLYFVGGLSQSFISFFLVEDRGSPAVATLARGLKMVMPHFDLFRVKNAVVYTLPLEPAYLLSITGYALAWMLLFVLLAERVFARKDL